MIRTRFLAAVTAAALVLGMSVGGAGAAFAATPTIDPNHGAGTTCNSIGYTKPAELDNLEAGTDSATFDWGTLSWDGNDVSWTINEGWTVDICVKGGNVGPSQFFDQVDDDSYSHSHGISHLGYTASYTAPVATAAVSTTDPNCFRGTSFTIDPGASSNVTWGDPVISGGSVSITATATGGALFAEGLSGVSTDRTQRTFTADYLPALPDDDPACTLPAINVTAAMSPITCEPGSGSFTAGVLDPTDPNADKLLWTTTEGTVPSASSNSVAGPTTVTVTVRLADDYVGGDFAVNDSSGDGVVSIVEVDGVETALITWTFEFTAATDCPTLTGSTASSQCEEDAPYLEWSIDLTDAGNSISFPTSATLTLRSTTDPSLTYTFPAVTINGTGVTTGSALWPGAAVDGDGNGTAWPGWAFVGGEWVVDNSNFGWVRGADVELLIEINPSIEIPVSYPNATPDCANPPVVVPEITKVDECVVLGLDEFEKTATFTVTRAANLSYAYTVNGGDPIAIVFPDGEDTVTITVAPLDVVEVTATPADGFRLAEDYAPWEHTFFDSSFCNDVLPATTASAVITVPDCLGNPGTVQLINELGVIWTLNGQVVQGNMTHTVPTGTAVNLIASLEEPSDEFPGGFGWSDENQQTEWNAVMEIDPEAGGEECLLDEEELPTLAFTGANGLTSWLGVFAVLAMIVGMGFVVRRHQLS